MFMKSFVAAAFVCLPACALAASADEEAYIKAEADFRAELQQADASGASPEAFATQHDKATADLSDRLKTILGDIKLDGLNGPHFSPESLTGGDMGSGNVDGLAYYAEEGNAAVLITTKAILANWFKYNQETYPDSEDANRTLADVIGSDDIFTYSVGMDAAFTLFDALPVTFDGEEATRFGVGSFAQDDLGAYVPGSLVMYRQVGDRVVIATETIKTTIEPSAACTKVQAKWKKASDADYGGEEATALLEKFNDCLKGEMPSKPYYKALIEQARELAKLAETP
ncbi:hypothetical protein [Oryzibacter oryziterrae]|uniref:hypothetical protein n=1 Tax=Oryzibacter oryziterrae TaxID=2766474 RepID=UPI001F2421CC|nr:hypothetical protein [Oryzibacter oryziterrae]